MGSFSVHHNHVILKCSPKGEGVIPIPQWDIKFNPKNPDKKIIIQIEKNNNTESIEFFGTVNKTTAIPQFVMDHKLATEKSELCLQWFNK